MNYKTLKIKLFYSRLLSMRWVGWLNVMDKLRYESSAEYTAIYLCSKVYFLQEFRNIRSSTLKGYVYVRFS